MGQPVQLLIGESVRTGEVADLGIAVEIGEQLVLLEEGCGEGLLIVYQVPMEYDMRESRQLYAQVGSSPLLFGTTMEVGNAGVGG